MKNTKKTVYETVTNTILSHLEIGTVPWRKTWITRGIPRNYFTKRSYRGINVILLNLLDYPTNNFISFKQVKELGGKVKKGEKGHIVVFWKWITPEKDQEVEIEQDVSPYPYIQFHYVWNTEQCSGLPKQATELPEQRDNAALADIDSLINAMSDKPTIQHVGDRAYYNPKEDIMNVPDIGLFEHTEAYYTTFFHELVHSTGHAKRLNRKGITEQIRFGSVPYSFEELIAEMGACYLMSHFGLESDYVNNAAYIQEWIKSLKNDKSMFVHACVQSQKAFDYVLNIQAETTDSETVLSTTV